MVMPEDLYKCETLGYCQTISQEHSTATGISRPRSLYQNKPSKSSCGFCWFCDGVTGENVEAGDGAAVGDITPSEANAFPSFEFFVAPALAPLRPTFPNMEIGEIGEIGEIRFKDLYDFHPLHPDFGFSRAAIELLGIHMAFQLI